MFLYCDKSKCASIDSTKTVSPVCKSLLVISKIPSVILYLLVLLSLIFTQIILSLTLFKENLVFTSSMVIVLPYFKIDMSVMVNIPPSIE